MAPDVDQLDRLSIRGWLERQGAWELAGYPLAWLARMGAPVDASPMKVRSFTSPGRRLERRGTRRPKPGWWRLAWPRWR